MANMKLEDAPPPRTWEWVKEWLPVQMATINESYGGPMQFLQKSFTTTEAMQNFKDQLMAGLPPDERIDEAKTVRPTAEFVRDVELGTEYCGHLSMFSFNAGASSKPAPYRTTVTSLVDEYLTNTFLTRGDPLVVYALTPEHPGFVDNDSFWLGYVKGAARTTTAMALAYLMLDLYGDAGISHGINPTFWESLTNVWVKWEVHNPSLEQVAFANAKLSARGAIRKANDIITWCLKLRTIELRAKRAPSDVIQSYNSQCTRESQIVGMKRTGALNLLKCDREVLDTLLEHVSKDGIEKVFFGDSTFSNSKIMPGSIWKLGSPTWTPL